MSFADLQDAIRFQNLRDCPECLPVVTRWHHGEWLRALGEDEQSTQHEEQYLEREQTLRLHLEEQTLPVTFVALHHGVPVGTVSLVFYTLSDGGLPSEWLSNLYVVPSLRSQGIATRLMDIVIKYAHNVGLERIFLYTRDQSDFYLKRNWRLLTYGTVQKQRVAVLDYLLS